MRARKTLSAFGRTLVLNVVLLVGLGVVTGRAQEPGKTLAEAPAVLTPERGEPLPGLEARETITPVDLENGVKLMKTSINLGWALASGFLLVAVLLPGFALREAGSTPGTSVVRAFARDFALATLGTIGFWICGYALMFGGAGLFLAGWNDDATIVADFSVQTAFLMAASLIPTGAMAGRWRFGSLCAYGLFFSMVPYPIYGMWVWGGGWLADLGVNFGLGNGSIDFAGSSVVHMTGGMVGLAGAWRLGPRIGRFNADGSPNGIPCRSVALVVLGTLLLPFGPASTLLPLVSVPFQPGSTLVATDDRFVAIAIHAMLAMGAGGFASLLWTWIAAGKPDVVRGCNGLLAGAVAIAGPCAFVDPMGAVGIGTLAGVLVNGSTLFVERVLKVDDPVGAISVHGVCGGFGCLCIGLFANGQYGAGWNGVAAAPLGLFYGGGLRQLAAELIGVGANLVLVLPLALACFWVVEKTIGHRVAVQPNQGPVAPG